MEGCTIINAVEISSLKYSYADGTEALKNIDLTLASQKRIAFLGANGSGKTTLLHHLNGLILSQTGSVEVMGYEVSKENLKSIRQLVGMVFDNPDNQLFSTTVAEDIAFGPRNLDLDEDIVQERVEKAMEIVEIADLSERPPYNLSLGQKKRVAIAGVLAMNPELLIFDEPFSGLDPRSANQLYTLLEKLYSEGRTIILTTHDVDMAYAWADQAVILSKGNILAQGATDLLRDKELMSRASLDVPMLAKAFEGTGMYPKTAEEANNLLLYPNNQVKVAK